MAPSNRTKASAVAARTQLVASDPSKPSLAQFSDKVIDVILRDHVDDPYDLACLRAATKGLRDAAPGFALDAPSDLNHITLWLSVAAAMPKSPRDFIVYMKYDKYHNLCVAAGRKGDKYFVEAQAADGWPVATSYRVNFRQYYDTWEQVMKTLKKQWNKPPLVVRRDPGLIKGGSVKPITIESFQRFAALVVAADTVRGFKPILLIRKGKDYVEDMRTCMPRNLCSAIRDNFHTLPGYVV